MAAIVSGNISAPPTPAKSVVSYAPPAAPSKQSTEPVALTNDQLQKKLDDNLKITGFKAEVDTSNPDQVVVRIVDGTTGDLILQVPSVTSLVIAEALRKSALDQGRAGAGTLIDEAA